MRPYFDMAAPKRFYRAAVGQELQFTVQAYSPASGSETAAAQTGLTYSTGALPGGAAFDSQVFTWTPTAAGVYQVQFIVSDGVIPESKTVTISVGNPDVPVANAGPSRMVHLGALVDSGRFREPGLRQHYAGIAGVVDAEFSWTQTAGPEVALGSGGSTAMSPTFVASAAGSYTFQLVVSDGAATSAPASVTITVPVLRQRRRGVRSFSSSGK